MRGSIRASALVSIGTAGTEYDEGSGAATAEPIQRAVHAATSKRLDVVRDKWKCMAVIPRGCRVKQGAKLMFLPL